MSRDQEKRMWHVIQGESQAAEATVDGSGIAKQADEVDAAWERFAQRIAGESPHVLWSQASVHRDIPATASEAGPATTRQQVQALPAVESARPARNVRSRRSPIASAWRLGGVAAALVVVVGFWFTGWGNEAMADMFQTFTVSNGIASNPGDLQTMENTLNSLEANGKPLKLAQFGEVSAQKVGGPETVSLAVAEQRIGFAVPVLPGADTSAVKLLNGRQVTLRIHVAAVNGLLQQLGGTVAFPQSVDGQPIVVNSNPVLRESTPDGSRTLDVTKLPELQVPSGVDVEQVRQALLSLPFLPDDMRADLANTATWAHTIVIPNAGNLQNTTVNGYSAILAARNHQIVWFANGIAYALSGTSDAFPTSSALVAAARELAR